MRRNMQVVLERWGRWSASEEKCRSIDWPAISVIPYSFPKSSNNTICSNADGIQIDSCIAKLKLVRCEDEILILGLRYIGYYSQRDIATAVGLPRATVERYLQSSINFVKGCLVMNNVSLDMDHEITEEKKLVANQKTFYKYRVQ